MQVLVHVMSITTPVFAGSSQESYALHFVQQATRLGYRSIVFNYRGIGGAELKVGDTHCTQISTEI